MLEQVVKLKLHLKVVRVCASPHHTARRRDGLRHQHVTRTLDGLNKILYDSELPDSLLRMGEQQDTNRVLVRELAKELEEYLLGHSPVLWVSFKHEYAHDFADIEG